METIPEPPIPEPYLSAHKNSSLHRAAVEASEWAGCFYCLSLFKPSTIRKWIDGDQTAVCPMCGIDSVLPLEPEHRHDTFLPEMRRHWFSYKPRGDDDDRNG